MAGLDCSSPNLICQLAVLSPVMKTSKCLAYENGYVVCIGLVDLAISSCLGSLALVHRQVVLHHWRGLWLGLFLQFSEVQLPSFVGSPYSPSRGQGIPLHFLSGLQMCPRTCTAKTSASEMSPLAAFSSSALKVDVPFTLIFMSQVGLLCTEDKARHDPWMLTP